MHEVSERTLPTCKSIRITCFGEYRAAFSQTLNQTLLTLIFKLLHYKIRHSDKKHAALFNHRILTMLRQHGMALSANMGRSFAFFKKLSSA
jgi:hypothetical protein